MDQTDRLAYEVAMAMLQDTRDDCLQWLEDFGRPPALESLAETRPTSRPAQAAVGLLGDHHR